MSNIPRTIIPRLSSRLSVIGRTRCSLRITPSTTPTDSSLTSSWPRNEYRQCIPTEKPSWRGGGVMFLSGSTPDLFRRAAGLVDKILKGTKPADIPVERPTKLEFWINFKTAKVLGLEIPEKLIALADSVIE